MTARTLAVVAMVTMTAVSTEICKTLDPVLWDYTSCPHPESDELIQLKMKMSCDKDRDYHCASNSQGCDVQLCVKRIYCEAGHRPLLDPGNNTVICAPCPENKYQSTGFWSNQRSYCEHEKTKCDGDGQIECQPGSAITDRSCRCDISQNMALQNYALHNETCCTENDPLCECIQFKSPCPSGTVRHDNYKCLKECPPNSFRLWNSETCYPNSTTVTVEMTTAHQTPAFGSTGLPDTVNVGLIVGLILLGLVLIVGLIVGLCVCHKMKKRKKVIVKTIYKDCVIKIKKTKTHIHDGRGTTINSGKNNKTKTTIYENPVIGNEDIGSFESIQSTSERSSLVEDITDNQFNSHSHDNLWNSHFHNNQSEINEESTGSLFKDTESEHRPVEHEEQVMAELKLQTDISRIGSSSEETAVKLIGRDPHESMEEVRTEEMCKLIQDDDNCSNNDTRKKEFFLPTEEIESKGI